MSRVVTVILSGYTFIAVRSTKFVVGISFYSPGFHEQISNRRIISSLGSLDGDFISMYICFSFVKGSL